MNNFVYHPAASRGEVNHGWLQARHTFSFARYHDPSRMHFGVLRVLNDDIVAPGMGFGTHPHDNMEIITIPLRGQLAHKDSMGNAETITTGEVQIMSAGTGVEHSEYNPSATEEVNLLQIWVFPNRQNVAPRYQQFRLAIEEANRLYQVLSPNPEDSGGWIYQNAWFSMGRLTADTSIDYDLREPANGVYIFVISGKIDVNGQTLSPRDGYGIWSVEAFPIACTADAQVLLMEVPMGFE